jgi:hypothetical protein
LLHIIKILDHLKRIFLLDRYLIKTMDFINQRIKRLNPFQDDRLEQGNHVPNIVKSEVEQLNNNIFKSIKMRNQNLDDIQNNQGSFKKMIDQMRGQDISNITNLTKEFEKKTRINY